jgi:protein-S-isoprenylcysteine O-methyltransferase Ste14
MSSAAPSRVPWPPIIYLSAIAAGILLHMLYPLPWITRPVSDLLFAFGWLLVAATIAIHVTAFRALVRGKTTIMPNKPSEHLVTSGPFSFTRNPIYLANTLLMLGIGLIIGSIWFLLLALLAAFVTQKLAVEAEEKHLADRFGKRYRDYSKRVRRWI